MVLTYLRPYFWAFPFLTLLAVILGGIAGLLTSLIGPAVQLLVSYDPERILTLRELMGEGIGGWFPQSFSSRELFTYLPWALLGLSFTKALCHGVSVLAWEWISEKAAFRMREDLVVGFLRIAPHRRAEVPEEELAPALATDIRLIREYMVHFYGGLPREALQVLFLLGTLFLLSHKLFLILCFGGFPLLYLISRLGKRLKRESKKALDQSSVLTEWLQQRLLGIETIKHYGAEPQEIQAMADLSARLSRGWMRAAQLKALSSPLTQFFAVAVVAVILMITLSHGEEISGGVALSFFSSVALLSQSGAICARYYNSNREAKGSIERVGALFGALARTKAVASPQPPPHLGPDGWLRFSQGTLAYGNGPTVLSHINLTLKKGHIYVLQGPSGSGKSTLTQALCGLLPLASGSLEKPQTDIKIGYVPQKVDLFPGTIADQVVYPRPWEVSQGAGVTEALKKAGVWEFVSRLPQGILTMGGSDEFSGGEKQRILLARIFYHDFDVILVDEGTSALDPQGESYFYGRLQEWQKEKPGDRTVVLIAHRPAALDIGTKIWEFRPGEVREV
jgi:subfamily B ATP-binding cassette protein MsbA